MIVVIGSITLAARAQQPDTQVLVLFSQPLDEHQHKLARAWVATEWADASFALDEPRTRLKVGRSGPLPVEGLSAYLFSTGAAVASLTVHTHDATSTWVSLPGGTDGALHPWSSLSDEQRIAVRAWIANGPAPEGIQFLRE